MKEWHELKNYRERYEGSYCGEIPEGHGVHHLDMNRGNNRVSDLIAIPNSIKDVFIVGMSDGACNMDAMPMSDMIEATGDLSKFVADSRRRLYETLMQRSVESGISEIFPQNM